jgi:microcystin-dependent protein
MSKKYSELIKAAMENLASAPATIKAGLMYFITGGTKPNRPYIDDGTDVSQLMLEKHLPEARRTTKVQLTEDVNVEVEGTLTHTKGGTGVNSLVGFSRKALVVKDDETGYEFGDAGGGAVFEANQVAHGLAALDVIYHDGSGWVKAQANAANTVAEYVVVEVFDVDNFKAAKFGKFEITAHGLTVGEHYFLSQLTAGALDVSEPITGYSCPILYAEDANNVHVEIYRANLIGDGIASDSEIGSIMAFGNNSTPTGFLPCDGREVSRITYGELFAAIGTKYGIGDGSSTFNLPDFSSSIIDGKTEEIVFSAMAGYSSNNSAVLYTNTVSTNTFSDLANVTHDSTDGLRLVALKKIVVSASASAYATGSGTVHTGWTYNADATQLDTSILSLPSGVKIGSISKIPDGPTASGISGNPIVKILNVGDSMAFQGDLNAVGSTFDDNVGGYINAKEISDPSSALRYIRYAAKGAVEAENKVNPTVIIPDATTDIDWQTGEVFTESRDADKTFTFSNTQDGKTIIVSIENTDVADHTINFPGTVSWPNGTAITNVVAGTTTVFTFVDFAGTIRATAVESF